MIGLFHQMPLGMGLEGGVPKSASNLTNSFGEDNVTLVTADKPKVRQRRRKSLRYLNKWSARQILNQWLRAISWVTLQRMLHMYKRITPTYQLVIWCYSWDIILCFIWLLSFVQKILQAAYFYCLFIRHQL